MEYPTTRTRSFVIVAALLPIALAQGMSDVETPASRCRIRWSRIPDLPERLSELSATAFGGRIYVVGGMITGDNHDLADNRVVNDNYAYDPSTNTWTRRSPVPTARYDVALAILGGRIYAISSENESYDPRSDAWQRHEPLPEGGSHLGAAAVGDEIFVFSAEAPMLAGRNIAFCPRTGTWREHAPMPTPRLFPGVVAVESKVYVMGGLGYDGQGRLGPVRHDVEVYDPAKDRWVQRGPMPDNIFGSEGIGVVDGKVLLIGVSKGERLGNTELTAGVYVYDPDTDQWGRATDLPTKRGSMGVALLGRRVFVIGGHDDDFVQYSESYVGVIEEAAEAR